MKKKIKEVNGVKVIRRYCAGTIFSAIFCLLLVAIPVVLLFIPWIKITSVTGSEDPVVASLTGIELIGKVFIGQLTGKGSTFATIFTQLATDSAAGYASYIGLGVIYGAPILYAVIAIFGVFFAFFFLELLFRGRMNHYKLPFIMAWPYFFLVATFSLVGVGLQFFMQYLYTSVSTPAYTLTMSSWVNYIYLGVALLSLICLGIIYGAAFKNKAFIGDVGGMRHANGSSENDDKNSENGGSSSCESTDDIIKKIQFTPAIGLPATLHNIGGHAFSENLNLIVAIIPSGIKSLGKGAFSNCGHLRVLSIPTSVRNIGVNCFFNCAALERINYGGSKEQWRHIKRGANWLTKAGTTTVICTDGAIIVNPFH